jgi:hypothetical protein
MEPESHVNRSAPTSLVVHVGPFSVSLCAHPESVVRWVRTHYGDGVAAIGADFADFHVRIASPRSHRRWFRKQVRFYLDGQSLFKPLPYDQAFALFEWGLNYCIAQFAHHYLMLHAAVVEKHGRAIVMPGTPGSGKSTLCAGLLSEGYRLLSDEFALVSPEDILLTPLPRPVNLKNAAIDLIRRRMPDALIGPMAPDTNKGTVAHLKAPEDSVRRSAERAAPAWIVFPSYDAEAEATALEPLSKGRSLMALAESSFNYSILGAEGFRTAADLVDRCECYTLTYSDLDEALAALNGLTAPSRAEP